MGLHNTLSAEEQSRLIDTAGKRRLTLSFYRYAHISNPVQFRNELFLAWNTLNVLGRIYVSTEGINAQLSLPADSFYEFKNAIEVYPFLQKIRLNVAIEHDDYSFLKLTIKVKDKIVADGITDATFDVTNMGVHLNAIDFNNMLQDPNTIVVDMRNHYESEVGHFINAIKPDVETFRESLPIIENQLANHKTDKNLLMYCTGGIRCEKASAYFKHHGFQNVFQLEGGIIEYTRQVQEQNLKRKFIGKNFVFDQRLGERVTDDIVSNCHQCGNPCDSHTNCVNDGCHLLFIQCDNCQSLMENCCSKNCLTTIHLPLVEQVRLRSGVKSRDKIFKKGKSETSLLIDKSEYLDLNSKPDLKGKLRKIKKIYLGNATHFYVKSSIGEFALQENSLAVGDTILIKGRTTGEQTLVITSLVVRQQFVQQAIIGDIVTLVLPFRIKLSDRFYKIIE